MKEKIYKIFVSEKYSPDFIQAYYIKGTLLPKDIKRICVDILTDPVTQEYSVGKNRRRNFSVEIAYNPGVMDPWEESLKKAIKDLGVKTEIQVKTSKIYRRENAEMNKVIQHVVLKGENPFPGLPEYKFKLTTIDLLGANDEKLLKISKDGQLFLNLNEMRAIKNYFKSIDRNPTDAELETLAQTWSEH
ncbi:MAG: phosphoribosylformylglycinamidine synthase, partial [Candidatus Omnitrophica bacterium CG_4_10_14_0_8_um_filter_43_18]